MTHDCGSRDWLIYFEIALEFWSTRPRSLFGDITYYIYMDCYSTDVCIGLYTRYQYIFYLGTCTFVHGSLLYMHICVTTAVCMLLLLFVFLTLTDPLRIQPWSQDRRNQTKSNRESEISRESRQKRTDKKVPGSQQRTSSR